MNDTTTRIPGHVIASGHKTWNDCCSYVAGIASVARDLDPAAPADRVNPYSDEQAQLRAVAFLAEGLFAYHLGAIWEHAATAPTASRDALSLGLTEVATLLRKDSAGAVAEGVESEKEAVEALLEAAMNAAESLAAFDE